MLAIKVSICTTRCLFSLTHFWAISSQSTTMLCNRKLIAGTGSDNLVVSVQFIATRTQQFLVGAIKSCSTVRTFGDAVPWTTCEQKIVQIVLYLENNFHRSFYPRRCLSDRENSPSMLIWIGCERTIR